MKNRNLLWGLRRISGELLRLGINVSRDTVARVIQNGRKEGNILPNGSWKRFLSSHMRSLFCCDFFCVDSVFNKRFYVFFIMHVKSRRIVQYGVTTNPVMRFVRNQLAAFMFDRPGKPTHLIHDNSGELRWFDYASLGITGVAITPYSPNMNPFAERFVRSVKSECFDHFIVVGAFQARNIMREYVRYYNDKRPHQGIGNRTPGNKAVLTDVTRIRKESVLFGLYTSYSLAA